jgi:enamine deaminase RidA (YjgF/YER057c/UK114 family)
VARSRRGGHEHPHACKAIAVMRSWSRVMPDLAEWTAMNEAYLDVIGAHTPARIAVGCDALLFGARVELDCIAYRPSAS